MNTPTKRARLGLIVLALAGWAGWLVWAWQGRQQPLALQPEPPEPVADLPLQSELPESVMDVPIHFDLDLLLERVEAHVPRTSVQENLAIGDSDTETDMAFTRGPFSASFLDDTVELDVTVAYALRSSYDLPLLPDMPLSCGTDPNKPAPRMHVRLRSPVEISPTWTLVTRTEVLSAEPASTAEADRCEVSLFGVDITERVGSGIRDFLMEHTTSIDSLVAEVDLASEVERWWDEIARPVRLDDDLWLQLSPESVAQASIRGLGDSVDVLARVVARPSIVFGARPDVTPRPLPALGSAAADRGFRATVQVRADYEDISEYLTRELRDESFRGAGHEIRIAYISMAGLGGNQVVLEVGVRGDVVGTLYLVGTPVFDEVEGFVRVPDASITVSTSDLLVAGASWIVDSGVESLLRDRIRWPVEGGIAWARERLEQGLNADLTDRVRLEGDISALDVLDVVARSSELLVRLGVTGSIALFVGED